MGRGSLERQLALGAALLTATTLLGPSVASGGGYMLPDSGIVANGRGGAFVAGADNQFAQYYNPAGLIRVDAPTINIGWSGVSQPVTFTRTGEDGTPMDPAVNQSPPFSVPQIGFAAPLVKDRVHFAIGLYSPFAPGYEFDADGPQRYSIIDTLIWNFAVGPSFAVKVVDQLTVGVGLQWQILRVGEQLKVTTSGLDDPAGDVAVDAEVLDLFTPSFNVGVLVEPIEQLSIGLAMQPPTRFEARGSGTLDFTGHGLEDSLDQTLWVDDDVGLELDMPVILRGGVAVRPVEKLEVEAAVVYEGWKRLQDIVVKDVDATITGEILGAPIEEEVEDRIALPAGFRDTISYRLGGEFDAADTLSLRMGGFYETAALRPEQVSVALVDTNKFQLGTGASLRLLEQRLTFDTAFAYLFYENLEITESEVTQINVYGGDEGSVGNGTMEAFGWVVGVQASYAFRKAGD